MCDASLACEGVQYHEWCSWDSWRIARCRADYWCEVCRSRIRRGQYAAVRVVGGDGSVQTERMHLACRSLWERVVADGAEVYIQETLESVEQEIDPLLARTHEALVEWSSGGAWVAPEIEEER